MEGSAEVLKEVKELSDQIGGFGNLIEEQRKTIEQREAEIKKHGEALASTDEKLAKIEVDIGKFDDLNGKLTAIEKAREKAEEEAKAKADEMAEQLDRVEVALKRAPKAGDAGHDEYRARVNNWARAVVYAHSQGEPNLSADQRQALEAAQAEWKALAVSVDTAAGYLASVEFSMEIIKGVTEISAMRPLIGVRTTSMKSIEIPKRTGQFAAVWVAEEATRSETTGLTYGLEEIPTHEMYALVDITEQMLEDAFLDMEREIREEATEQFAVAEGAAVVTGDSSGKPEGFLDNTSVGETNSGSAATIADSAGQANGLITLYHAIKTAYAVRGTWVLNRTTLGAVRRLKDGDNNYVWQPGLATLRPNTILDAPYVEVPDMPNEAAGAFPIAYGDWSRGYTLVDRVQMSMLRDPYTQATGGKIRFIFRKRVGGQVTLPEAIRKLKCSA